MNCIPHNDHRNYCIVGNRVTCKVCGRFIGYLKVDEKKTK